MPSNIIKIISSSNLNYYREIQIYLQIDICQLNIISLSLRCCIGNALEWDYKGC